jgi:RHS repeat-associated protein
MSSDDITFLADGLSSIDYYPFGMLKNTGAPDSTNYLFGFQGQEKDDEVKGDGNSYYTEFRMYDPRLGRWLSTDKIQKYHESPYVAFGNNPNNFIDPDGLDRIGLIQEHWEQARREEEAMYRNELENQSPRITNPNPEEFQREIERRMNAKYYLIDEQPQEQLSAENQNMSISRDLSPGNQSISSEGRTSSGIQDLSIEAEEDFNDFMTSNYTEGALEGAGVAGTVNDAIDPVLESRRALQGTQYADDVGEAIRRANWSSGLVMPSLTSLRSTPVKLLPGIGSAIAVVGMVHDINENTNAYYNGDIGLGRLIWRDVGSISTTVVSIPAPFLGVAIDYIVFKGGEASFDFLYEYQQNDENW